MDSVAAAKRFEDALQKYPIEEQLAVSMISKNVINGCSWEFVRSNPDIKHNLENFKKSETCSVQKVTYNHERGTYGYLVFMKMDRLCELLGPKNFGPFDAKDLEYACKHRQEAVTSLAKKIQSGFKGKIGIFCTNDSQTITVDGTPYPAYAISLKELCTVCQQYGYGIVVSGKARAPQEVLEREDAVIESCLVAPSSNALFINIGPMR